MIKALFFDFGQTLVNSASGFKKAEKNAQLKIFRDLSLSDNDTFMSHYRCLRKSFHGRSNFSRYELWQEIYHYYCRKCDPGMLAGWESQYWDTVKTNTVAFPETVAVLTALSRRYPLALITNTQGQTGSGTHRIALFPEIETFFKTVIVAGENGLAPKPDPAPFRAGLEALQIMPAEAVYVGDDWRIDILGARSAGLQAVWLKHYSVKRNWPDVQSEVPVITDLNPLCDIEALGI